MKSRNLRSSALQRIPGGAFILIAVMLLLGFSDTAFARGGFHGGGFRFSSSYRSFGGFRSSRTSTGSFFRWGSSTRSARSWGRTRTPINTATAIGGSRVSMASQRSLYTAARQRGTIFGSRTEAAQAFRSRYASQYTSRFASRPNSRPSYIPRTASVNGRTVNVVYNQQRGGYGYIDPALGHWVFFNALANTAMLNGLMASHAYWWGAPPAYYGGGSFFSTALVLFFIFIGGSTLLRIFRQGVRRYW